MNTRVNEEVKLNINDIIQQAGENSRMYANSRFSNLSAFLTYISFIVAAIAILHSTDKGILYLKTLGVSICALGAIIALLFLAIEHSHHLWWKYYESRIKALDQEQKLYVDELDFYENRRCTGRRLFGISATYATYGIYIVTFVFFILTAFFILK